MTAYTPRHAPVSPRLTAPDLPAPRPSRLRRILAWLRPARTVQALPRHDGDVIIDSRDRVVLRVIPRQATADSPPWDIPTAAFPVITDAEMRAEYFAAPVYGEVSVAEVLAAEDAERERERAAAVEAGIRARAICQPAELHLLAHVLEGVKAL